MCFLMIIVEIELMMITRFLLASLNMDAVLAEATIHQRRQALNRMSKGLGLQDAYDTTLDRIRKQGGGKSRLGMEALMWISRSERPLRSIELCHALGVELGAEDFNTQNVPSIRTVLAYTLGLVTFNEQASATPRLLHSTLQEYLRQHPTLFVTAHSMMAEICLTYLNGRSVRALSPDLDEVLETPPFLEYATCFWGTHAARGVTDPVKSLALRLLNGYENHVSATVLWESKIRDWWSRDGDVEGITGFHCIAFWGIAEIAVALLGVEGRQVNESDSRGWTPLMWAVQYKNRGIVELFLEQEDIELEAAIEDGRTILSFAAELGDEDTVKLLLEHRDVNPNSTDSNGRTPLLFAVESGQEGVVKLLLECRDVDPNSPDSNGQTPLSLAAEKGYEAVVGLLLQRGDLDPNSADKYGRTLLWFAAGRSQEGLVKMLLERGDVDPNFSDTNGRTPLSFAAQKGHDSVVKLLLKWGDINPNLSDNYRRTPLSFAAEQLRNSISNLFQFSSPSGHVRVMNLLLERVGVDPNSPDGNGRTPLSFAAESGEEDVVKLLLQRRDVNPNSPDRNGRTPLSFAAEGGQKSVVKLLLERGDVDPNPSDNNGQTPLSLAAGPFREPGVYLGIFANVPRHKDEAELLRNRGSVVKLLQERVAVDPNSSDNNGQTSLSFAAEEGHEGVVKLLLERGDVDPDLSDNNGQTALPFATKEGQEGAVQLPRPTQILPRTTSPAQTIPIKSIASTPDPNRPYPDSQFPHSFFPPTFTLFMFLFFALMICHWYGDSLELFHAIRPAWP